MLKGLWAENDVSNFFKMIVFLRVDCRWILFIVKL